MGRHSLRLRDDRAEGLSGGRGRARQGQGQARRRRRPLRLHKRRAPPRRRPHLRRRGRGHPPAVHQRPRSGDARALLPSRGEARAHRDTHPALPSGRVEPLQRDERPVLARLPLQLRVLRHHRDLRPRAAHEVQPADAGRVGRPARGGLARAGLHRGRQLHRQQEERSQAPAGVGRLVGAQRPPVLVHHGGVREPGGGRRALGGHEEGELPAGVPRA